HDHLRFGIDRDLRVVALHESALVSAIGHDAAFRIGEVALRRVVWLCLLGIVRYRLAATLLLAGALFFLFALGQLLLGLGALLRGLFFGFLFQSRLGFANLPQPALAPLQLGRQFVAALSLAVLRILFGIGLFGGGQQRIDLLFQARLGLVHVLVAAE